MLYLRRAKISMALDITLPGTGMILKTSFQLAFLTIEIILAFNSAILSESLIFKFLFFVIFAILIAMAVTRLVQTVLPVDKEGEGNDKMLPEAELDSGGKSVVNRDK